MVNSNLKFCLNTLKRAITKDSLTEGYSISKEDANTEFLTYDLVLQLHSRLEHAHRAKKQAHLHSESVI